MAWLATVARSLRRVLVVVTCRPSTHVDVPGATRIELEVASGEAVDLAHQRAEPVLERDDTTVVSAAAVLGARLDVDLLAEVLGRAHTELLDALEVATMAGLLVERDGRLEFRHEPSRLSLAASVLAPRRELLHGAGALALFARPSADPLDVAWHAERGGLTALATAALRRAAGISAHRFELVEARELLDRAVALSDEPETRVARARVHLAMRRLDLAKLDADRAVELRADSTSLEVAGWIAYYRRDHELARACAEEGLARADDPRVQASLHLLAGRHCHTRGELAAAARHLETAIELGSEVTRALGRVWLASLRAHTGRPAEATALAARASVDVARSDYPFAVPHALFARAVSLGHAGRVAEALASLDELDAETEREGVPARRFAGVSANTRAWLLRNLGRTEQADELNGQAARLPLDLEHAEVHYAAHLDLIEGRFLVGDDEGARAIIERIAAIETWEGSIAWRHRERLRLQRSRLALAGGDPVTAELLARSVQRDATVRRSRRYAVLAELTALEAAIIGGAEVADLRARIGTLLDKLRGIAEPEAWWVTARAASVAEHEPWWRDAQQRVDELAARAGSAGERLPSFAAALFTRWRGSR